MRTPKHGRISPATAAKMAAGLPASMRPALALLIDYPRPVHAAARYDDDGGLGEFSHLWPGPAADRRITAAASARAALSDEENYELLYGASDGQGVERRDTTHLTYSGSHTHTHADGKGGTHSHEHAHDGDALHTGLPGRAHREP
jgi:hypothetical protein